MEKEQLLKSIKSGLGSNFENLSFQIDFINSEITPKREIVDFLNDNSTKLQHLLDEEPRVIRWWFENIDKALTAMVKISSVKDLTHRLICIEKNALFIQEGEF